MVVEGMELDTDIHTKKIMKIIRGFGNPAQN